MSESAANSRIAVAMLGGRMGYAVPLILYGNNALSEFYTDFYAGRGIGRMCGLIPDFLRPPPLRRMLARDAGGIPARHVRSFNRFGMEYRRRIRAARGEKMLDAYLWGGEEFCRLINLDCDWSCSAVYSFNTASLGIFDTAGRMGIRKILEQTIAPYVIESEICELERSRYQGWEVRIEKGAASSVRYIERERSELESADAVICGSEYVRKCVGAVLGSASKCVVVPYGVNAPDSIAPRAAPEGRPIRVLFVGSLCLRKGIQYVAECAAKMKGRAEFVAVGPSLLTEKGLQTVAASIRVVGSVPRAAMDDYWNWADVLILPSLCEGSATVTYEALSRGVPVICTEETGSPVCDGVDGFLVQTGASEAIVEKLELMMADANIVQELSGNALRRRGPLSVAEYGKRLIRAIGVNSL